MDNILHLVGLAKRAGQLEAGDEPVGAACRARSCRLILVAQDAADNTYRRVRHFADAGAWSVSLAHDGVHFTEQGHRAFAAGLWEVLRGIGTGG